MSQTNQKKFDEWTGVKVDCNECAKWWDDSCTGIVSEGDSKRCTAFQATRSVVIPAQIEALTKRVKWLNLCCILMATAMILHLAFGG